GRVWALVHDREPLERPRVVAQRLDAFLAREPAGGAPDRSRVEPAAEGNPDWRTAPKLRAHDLEEDLAVLLAFRPRRVVPVGRMLGRLPEPAQPPALRFDHEGVAGRERLDLFVEGAALGGREIEVAQGGVVVDRPWDALVLEELLQRAREQERAP